MDKPIVLITGASGNVGIALCAGLRENFYVIGLDVKPCDGADQWFKCDLTKSDSIALNFQKIANEHGNKIASVVHLAAYFDFTGKAHPLYQKLNVQGTEYLLKNLQNFDVERFIYSSTMLVHQAEVPGTKITEQTPIAPQWAYPESKASAETIIQENAGSIPYSIVRMAGLYDDCVAVPTLSHQVARIYERNLKSWLYAGDKMAGQAFLHQQDMLELFSCILNKRNALPKKHTILAGEEEVMSFQALQNRIGNLIHGKETWNTISMPKSIAKPGAWVEEKSEPVVPDAIDHGTKPFIRPFMIDMASDHYDLDVSKVKTDLDWQPKKRIYEGLEKIVDNLKQDPANWYQQNGITAPDWVQSAEQKNQNPNSLREQFEKHYKHSHFQFMWAHMLNVGLAFWLLTAPFILAYESHKMVVSDVMSGVLLLVFASLSLYWRMGVCRYLAGAVGLWVLGAPLLFWAPTAGAYLNGTIIGLLIMGFALCSRPSPGVACVASETGPNVPPGWDFNPSLWVQRLPIIVLAFIGFFISRYLCAYQLGHIDAVWEPFFSGSLQDGKNGTEQIITSSISEAWPVPDAGLGGMVYALEIITGMMGSVRRWRTMPWLVILFGVMIVPLGAVSIFFIIIQPVVIGTWCTLCLIGAAAMLFQIPYSLDELVATSEFLYRRKKQGRPLLRIFFLGDTDQGKSCEQATEFDRPVWMIVKDTLGGGINLSWNLAVCILIGIFLMTTRLSIGNEGTLANIDHVVGALAITLAITAMAETGRICRFLIIPLGLTLLVTPFIYDANTIGLISSLLSGLGLVICSFRKGDVVNKYGKSQKLIL